MIETYFVIRLWYFVLLVKVFKGREVKICKNSLRPELSNSNAPFNSGIYGMILYCFVRAKLSLGHDYWELLLVGMNDPIKS